MSELDPNGVEAAAVAMTGAPFPSKRSLAKASAAITAYLSTLSPLSDGDGWSDDMSAAPRDGRELNGYRPDQGVFTFRWATMEELVAHDINGDPTEDYDESQACWWHDRWGWLEKDSTPTRWRPLPAPPRDELAHD